MFSLYDECIKRKDKPHIPVKNFGIYNWRREDPPAVQLPTVESFLNFKPTPVDIKPTPWVHPNSPQAWFSERSNNDDNNFQYANQPGRNLNRPRYFRPCDLPVPAAVQNARFLEAQRYINQRGPVYYQYLADPCLPQKWVPKFKNKIEQKINDPQKLSKPYWYPEWMQDRWDPVTGQNVDEAYRENNYYALKQEAKDLYKANQEMGTGKINFGNGSSNGQHKRPRPKPKSMRSANTNHKSLREKNEEMKSMVPPGIDPRYLAWGGDTGCNCMIGGEPAFCLSAAQGILQKASAFSQEEKAQAYAAAMKGYNIAKTGFNANDLLERQDVNNQAVERQLAPYAQPYQLPNPWTNYGHASGTGLPCVTAYTKEEMESGKVPIFLRKNEKLEVKTLIKDDRPSDRDENGHLRFLVGYIKDGKEFDPEKQRFLTDEESKEKEEKIKELKDQTEKFLIEKDLITQSTTDDVYRLAKEIARYNVYLANMLCWLHANASQSGYNQFKGVCLKQLLDYRNADPFALVKSTAWITNKGIVIGLQKPISMSEIDSLVKQEKQRIEKIKEEIRSNPSQSTEILRGIERQLECLDQKHTLKEKLQAIRALRDYHILDSSKELSTELRKAVYNSLNELRKKQFDAYNWWKFVYGFGRKDDPEYDKTFDIWWNSPNGSIESIEDKLYQTPANDINAFYIRFSMKEPEYSQEELDRIGKANWEKFTGGLFNNIQNLDDMNRAVSYLNSQLRDMDYAERIREYNKNYKPTYDHDHYNKMVEEFVLYRGLAKPNPDTGRPDLPMINDPATFQKERQLFVNSIFQHKRRGTLT